MTINVYLLFILQHYSVWVAAIDVIAKSIFIISIAYGLANKGFLYILFFKAVELIPQINVEYIEWTRMTQIIKYKRCLNVVIIYWKSLMPRKRCPSVLDLYGML